MNIFLNKKNFYLFIIFYSFFAIFFALYVEYILGYKPCKLCVYQRVPYIAAIFVSFVGYNYFKNIRILILIIIIFTISALISGYHYGIENSIFEEFSGCTSNTLNIFDKSKLAGSPVELEVWTEMFHGWQNNYDFLLESRQAVKNIGEFFKKNIK